MTERGDQAAAKPNHDVLRLAERTWRRAGVRCSDRRELRLDLSSELAGASAAGMSDSAVLGPDPAATLRQLAQENGFAGRSLWLGRFLAAAVFGAIVGSAPVLLLYGAEFSNGSGTSWDSPFLYYPVFGALAYGLSLLLVAATLHVSGDLHVRRSVRLLALSLPITAVVAALAGSTTAASQNYETRPQVFITTAGVVLVVFLVGCALARVIATRQHRRGLRPPTAFAWDLRFTP